MALINLKTAKTKTVTVASAMLVTPADRTGLGFDAARAYPTDPLSRGRFPSPRNPEPEQLRSRQGWSDAQVRKQMRPGTPDPVPPTGPVGVLTPGPRADLSRSRAPMPCVTLCHRDCHSPVQRDDKRGLTRAATPTTAAGK